MKVGVVLLLVAVQSTQATPTVRATLDTAVMTVGDHLHLRVAVTHTAGARVRWPDSLDLTPFEVLDVHANAPVAADDQITTTYDVTLTTFEIGAVELPSFAIAVDGPGGSDTVTTDGWRVTVESVGLDEGGDIRDLKAPLSIPRNWLLMLPWALGVMALIGIGVWAYRRYRRTRSAPTLPALPPRPPHEIAYAALDALERERLLDRGEVKHHYIRVSDIGRAYIEGRYGVEALEMATTEVVRDIAAVGVAASTMDEVRRFLETCDLVKFAKLTPAPDTCREIVPAARRIVDLTKAPPPPAEPTPESAATEPPEAGRVLA